MLEDINGHNLASQNLHYGSNGQSGPRWSACPNNGSTCQTGYHTYTVLIDRRNTRSESLQFSIDNTVTQTVTESSVGTSAWQAAVDHGFYLILNLAIGGTWPDADCGCTAPTAATTSGGSMSVGYVAVYEYRGNSTPTATARATGPLAGPGPAAWPTRGRSTPSGTRSTWPPATAAPGSSGRLTATARCASRAAASPVTPPARQAAAASTGTPVSALPSSNGRSSPTGRCTTRQPGSA